MVPTAANLRRRCQPLIATTLAVVMTANCRAQSTLDPPDRAGPGRPAASQPASQPTRRPASQPTATTQPASVLAAIPASSGDSQVDAILDRLEAKGKAIKGLSAALTYAYVTVFPVEDEIAKEGTLLFARGEPNARFRVHFTKKIAAGTVDRNEELYVFDGQWLVIRNDKAKTVTRHQIAREGEHTDPFAIGKGPFPLPFGQRRDEMLENFKISLKPFELGDPLQSGHLHCVPRPGTDLAEKYTRIEMYVDKRLDLPIRIVCERTADGNRIEVDFKEVDVSRAPAGSRFGIGEIPTDFTETVEPLSEIAKPETSNP